MAPGTHSNELQFELLLKDINACRVCASFLEHEPRPVLQASARSRIVIIGQAPGSVVHKNGIPWLDKSGDNLRTWLNIDTEAFYDPGKIALIPMGFCYPGKGKSGDLPPRKECAPLWHEALLQHMPDVKLTLLIGKYAQKHYLGKASMPSLTETVKNFKAYLPKYFVLPHPSPRNNIWMAKNPWFRDEVIPHFRTLIEQYV